MTENTTASGDWDDWDDKPKKKRGKHHFKAWEDEIVKENWQTKTDEWIGEKIGRTAEAVARRRKALGFTKKSGRPAKKTRQDAIFTNPTEYNLSQLSKDDRLEFYKTKFTQNKRYQWLQRTLMDDELEYYRIKYIETIDSLDSISLQEEDLLHNMIMTEIQIIRLQVQVKDQLQQYYDNDDDEARPPPQWLYKDLSEAEARYVRYQEKLKLTREQRLKTDKEEKITIAAMVRSFLDAQNRQRAGEMAGQMSYGMKKCKDDMDKMQFLIGG